MLPENQNEHMSCELFVPKGFRTLAQIDQANTIIAEYQAEGFTLTLRQLYYQFVARGLLAENTLREYKRLGRIVREARDAGLIDWDAIEDRTREVNNHSWWHSPADIIESAASSYCEDLWQGQPYRPEVWIEKDALLGVIEAVCTEFRCPYFSHRGNCSQTLVYEAGQRFAGQIDHGLLPLVLHLADHDPNGIDMTRDLTKRFALYARQPIEVRRIALNMDHVERYRPPPNFAKEGDTRTSGYVERFGTEECWELDALSPTVIADLVRSEIRPLIDVDCWEEAIANEERGREQLRAIAETTRASGGSPSI